LPEQKKYTTISVPVPLHNKVKSYIKDTGFTSVSDYVTYVLRELMAESSGEGKSEFSKEDEEKVKARLRALGYID